MHTYGEAAGGQRLYVDGVLRASGVKAQSDFDWQQRINIGFANDAVLPHFDVLLDDVHIFNRALSEDDIDALILGDAQFIGRPLQGSQNSH